jgi:hypothetical protein
LLAERNTKKETTKKTKKKKLSRLKITSLTHLRISGAEYLIFPPNLSHVAPSSGSSMERPKSLQVSEMDFH